jgi:hypothetical protein
MTSINRSNITDDQYSLKEEKMKPKEAREILTSLSRYLFKI